MDLARLSVGLLANFVLASIAGLAAMSIAAGLIGYQPVVITTGSMRPVIMPGDVIVTDDVDGQDLAPPTVIDYVVEGTNQTRMHRIVEVLETGYRTKGDANPSVDNVIVAPENVRGVGIALLPFAGLPRVWIQNEQWLRLGLATLALVGLALLARMSWIENLR